jgi:ABC-type phosphate transport system substrate-binding protein
VNLNVRTLLINRNISKLALILFFATGSLVARGEVVVIVSSKSNITNLTGEQTARIFLGKNDKFPNGQSAIPIDQPEGEAVRDEFYSKVTRKNASQLATYWAKLIFTGEGRLSEIAEDDKDVVKKISNNPNAIGYIDKSALKKNVRVVLTPQ